MAPLRKIRSPTANIYGTLLESEFAPRRLGRSSPSQSNPECPEEWRLGPEQCWLEPCAGHHEKRFLHGYYGHDLYLPLYIFWGEVLLCARLRASNIDASAGSVEELKRIVKQIR